MILSELHKGESAILLAVPESVLSFVLRPGGRVQLILSRPELTVVEVDGARFALSPQLSDRIVVLRAPS